MGEGRIISMESKEFFEFIRDEHIFYVKKDILDLVLILLEELVLPVVQREQFRVVIEKKPNKEKVSVEFRFNSP